MTSTKEDMVTRFLAYDFATEIREWLVERVIREEGAIVALKALRADYEAWIDHHSVYLGFPLSPYHWSMALAAVIPPAEGSIDMPNASFADYRLRIEADESEGAA